VKFGLKTIAGIFYNGPYVWELLAPQEESASKIEELHEGGLLDHIFYPGISVSISGNKFKVTRRGIGHLPMSGNSFVHVFVGKFAATVPRRLCADIFGSTLSCLDSLCSG
jgi:hypothetical protein